MAIAVLIIGESGTGKSSSMRNFSPDEVGIVNVEGKPLPFRGKLPNVKTDNYTKILNVLANMKAPSAVIDDCQYLLIHEQMRRRNEHGYDKYLEIAGNYFDLIRFVIDSMPADKIVYFMSHSEIDANGREKIKTVGKMLDEKVNIEGMFSIVLKTAIEDGRYVFRTHNSGSDVVKTPLGMFEADTIDNDLKMVDTTIRSYYEMN